MRYDDILHEQRPVHDGDAFFVKHPPMPVAERAKIFSPFAALKGYDDAIDERQVITVRPRALSEGEKEAVNDALTEISVAVAERKTRQKTTVEDIPMIRATLSYFQPDAIQEEIKKDGDWGQIVEITGSVSAVDTLNRVLIVDNRSIRFEHIYDLRMVGIENSTP